MVGRTPAVALLAAMLLVASAPSASAAVMWDGDAANGTGVFAHIGSECADPGSVTAVDDPEQGAVWRYDKPAGLRRCESRGIKVDGQEYDFRNGSTYYLGWRSRLSSTVDNNATFQWKSYGSHIQNYPVVLKVIDGKLSLLQRQPDETRVIWDQPIRAGEWHSIVLGLHLSDETTGGWVELWFNGERQTFSDGSQRWACRTFDSENHPKWGVYGAEGDDVVNEIDALKIGSEYADVAP
ncbi:heparin lyase I family protein [Saccharopolyspora antimicrobica]|uniref:heparin lyase I family protein n=1 Tax=Saccharopolyspora antimicrobica TaxID=455193 RepID=UPI001FE6AE8B|nr:heparin lyase I family protein [Saccharopolyspora antimicrobica]